jgi:hypothetical protein
MMTGNLDKIAVWPGLGCRPGLLGVARTGLGALARRQGMLRALLGLCIFCPTAAIAETYHDLGRPDQCGTYAEASYDRESWFGGGEGGLITLTDPQSVPGLNAVVFDGVISEEGFSDPAGQILALRGPLLTSEGSEGGETVVILTKDGLRVLQACP